MKHYCLECHFQIDAPFTIDSCLNCGGVSCFVNENMVTLLINGSYDLNGFHYGKSCNMSLFFNSEDFSKRESTINFRSSMLMDLGLRYDGEQFSKEDINYHWTELTCDTNQEFYEKWYEIKTEIKRREKALAGNILIQKKILIERYNTEKGCIDCDFASSGNCGAHGLSFMFICGGDTALRIIKEVN